MPSTRDIRRRIKSVKNTRQITKAMELVSASKMKRAQQVAIGGLPYGNLLADVLAALDQGIEESLHPFLVQREVKHRGILLITSDKGLCGPLNANLFKKVSEIRTPAKFYTIGRKGAQFLARTKRQIVADFQVHDRIPYSEVKVASEFMIKQYLEGQIDTIEVVYPRFKNTLVQEPTVRPILPLSGLMDFLDQLARDTGTPRHAPDKREIHFEPSPRAVLDALLPFYVDHQVYQLALSMKASEHSARMVAMKTAKDNATELLGDLTLEYNKARQAAITQEILEIAAASFSAA
ncbi:MAG TPA: ATP synthase F1 subunit gamma [Opitutaceae bacterium]|jgi:F-type H+-transporting ATPase subunit gamma